MAKKSVDFTSSAPVGGSNFIGPEYLLNNLYTQDAINMRIVDGIMKRRLGYSDIAASYPNASNPIMESFEYGNASGALKTLFFDTAEMVELNVGAGTWADKSGANDFTGDATNPIFVAAVGGLASENIYVTNNVDAIKVWDGAAANWSDLTTTGFSTLLAGCCVGYRGHLILGNTTEDGSAFPYRVRWSTAGNPTTWNTTTAGFINLIEDNTNSEVMCMHPMKQVLMVYKFDSIYQLIYQGDPNYFVQIPREMSGGAISPKGVAPFEGGHFVVSNDNLHVFDGFSFIHPAPGNAIKSQFFSELNWDARGTIFCKTFPGEFEIWTLYPTGVSTVPNKAVCWNYKDNTWTFHEFESGVTHSLGHFLKSFSQPQPTLNLAGKPVYLFNGNTDDGTNIDAYFRTKIQNFQELEGLYAQKYNMMLNFERIFKTVHAVEIDASGTIPSVSVGITNTIDGTPSFDTPQTPTVGATGLYYVTTNGRTGRYLTLKVAQNDANAPFVLKQYTLEVEPQENLY